MKKIWLTLILLVLSVSPSIQAQKHRHRLSKTKHPIVKSAGKTSLNSQKIISGGVVNGRAISMPKPSYPRGACAVNVQGTVNVSILIDEEGNVIEATAVSGHPLLRPNSVVAALNAKFVPILISGSPVKVRGVITYKYSLDKFNWLEIGRAAENIRFVEMLPYGFDEERQMFEQYKTADEDSRTLIFESIRASIENKLIDQKKALWLFQTGKLFNELQNNCCRIENLEENIRELKLSLSNSPENISPALISKLENIVRLYENPQLNIYTPEEGSKIYRQIQEINEMLPMLGY